VPGVAAEAGPVGAALNQAANQVAREVAAWVG
jgi:cholesterol transport system auxiliary component